MQQEAKYQPLYRRIGHGITSEGKEVTFEVACHAFEGWDGLRVGVIRWLVKSRDYEREMDNGKCAIIDHSLGYFADTIEHAVSLYRELSVTYSRELRELAEIAEVLHG